MNAIGQLAERVAALEANQVRLRLGEVITVSPFTVSVGGADPVTGIGALAGTTYAVGDVVVVQSTPASQLVLGVLGNGS